MLIIEEYIASIGDKHIYRYHLCSNWLYSYWKSRTYLTACIAQAWKNKIYVMGRFVEQDFIDRLSTGENFLEFDKYDGALPLKGRRWYPEEMAMNPEVFLKDIDAEHNDFGITSALRLWLELANKGYMDIDIETNAEFKSSFMTKLTDYKC